MSYFNDTYNAYEEFDNALRRFQNKMQALGYKAITQITAFEKVWFDYIFKLIVYDNTKLPILFIFYPGWQAFYRYPGLFYEVYWYFLYLSG